MTENSTNSKRIAKNTLMLYFRMLLMMGVTLYTSRVVLSALGVEDYGIYNVVGGVVAMFTMISSSLSSAISRFITFELGKGNQERLNTIFSTSVIIQLLIGIIITILIETVGMWFLENKMVIPADRLVAARWVLQFSLITLVINLLSIPYNAAIIAHERMSAFAYISILEAFGKLGIAYFITITPIDKLIFYAILMAVVALINRFTYSIYCRRHFEEAKFRWVFDKALLKEMFGFAGWNFIDTGSYILRIQGGNILLNILGGGPAINAAKGIASQVNGAISGFATNFMTAINPQIMKSYAVGDTTYVKLLITQSARFGFYLLLIISSPIIINTNYVLALWLGPVVPEYTVDFIRLIIIQCMCEIIMQPLKTTIQATGDIRNCQITIGLLQLMNLPLSYILLKAGWPPTVVFSVSIVLSVCCIVALSFFLRAAIGLSVRTFVRNVGFNIVVVAGSSMIISYLFKSWEVDCLSKFILSSVLILLVTSFIVIYIGCNKNERLFFKEKLNIIISKFNK